MGTIEELLAKVKAATGPDRDIDRELAGYAIGTTQWRNIPGYTASIDAALALTERVLPGWKWNVGMDALDEVHATVWHGVTEEDHYAATPPLAILAATLSALAQVKP